MNKKEFVLYTDEIVVRVYEQFHQFLHSKPFSGQVKQRMPKKNCVANTEARGD